MKDVQDRIAQMKQKKTQTDLIGKPRILDHNELIAAPIEDNIDHLGCGESSSNTKA